MRIRVIMVASGRMAVSANTTPADVNRALSGAFDSGVMNSASSMAKVVTNRGEKMAEMVLATALRVLLSDEGAG